jgi:protein-L-isoaspartate(D-aspartate) O-methyltransferase
MFRTQSTDIKRMVRHQLAARDITDRRVLAAMASVPRDAFVPEHLRQHAFDDGPLPIGHGQTISQPYIVALMTQAAQIDRRSRVLDVGTGSGYQTAVLAKLASHVWSIERLEPLAREAQHRLASIGFTNITYVVGDGALGHEKEQPYDAIIVAAAAPKPPRPLCDQLALGGRLVVPIGDRALQDLTIIERTTDGYRTTSAGPCRFVPLVSEEAFGEE